MSEAYSHGGALGAAIRRHGGERRAWLDLSTGINPCPPTLPAIPPERWERLPERDLEARVIEAARRCYGAPAAAGIVAAPGSQALISALPHLLSPALVAIVEPTYGEHRIAFEAAGHRVVGIADLDGVPEAASIVVVVNPNNPDGRLHPAAALLGLADRLAGRGGLLVVDEAFMDFDPSESLAPHAGRRGLLVHRSFGKFFGLPGLRLGFALTEPALAARLAARLGPWAVSGPALHVGAEFLGAGARGASVRLALAGQAERLRQVLAGAGLEVVGGCALFALVRHDRAGALFEGLCRRCILTRPFAYRRDWLRIGNVADEPSARRLEDALRAALADLGPAR